MSRLYLIVWLLLIIYGRVDAFIDNSEVSINLGVKSYPFSGSVDTQFKAEKMLWDSREKAIWSFSMVQPKLTLASHGLAEASVSFFPIGFLEFGASTSVTSRFYDTKNFDCSTSVCQGILRRNALFIRALAGKQLEFGQAFLYGSASLTTANHSDDTKPFIDEVEKLSGNPGQDELSARTIGFGLKRPEATIILLNRKAQYKKTEDKNETTSLVLRRQLCEYKVSAGVGQFQSNRWESGLVVMVAVSVAEGVSASLF